MNIIKTLEPIEKYVGIIKDLTEKSLETGTPNDLLEILNNREVEYPKEIVDLIDGIKNNEVILKQDELISFVVNNLRNEIRNKITQAKTDLDNNKEDITTSLESIKKMVSNIHNVMIMQPDVFKQLFYFRVVDIIPSLRSDGKNGDKILRDIYEELRESVSEANECVVYNEAMVSNLKLKFYTIINSLDKPKALPINTVEDDERLTISNESVEETGNDRGPITYIDHQTFTVVSNYINMLKNKMEDMFEEEVLEVLNGYGFIIDKLIELVDDEYITNYDGNKYIDDILYAISIDRKEISNTETYSTTDMVNRFNRVHTSLNGLNRIALSL